MYKYTYIYIYTYKYIYIYDIGLHIYICKYALCTTCIQLHATKVICNGQYLETTK